jgi:hypothetical protein
MGRHSLTASPWRQRTTQTGTAGPTAADDTHPRFPAALLWLEPGWPNIDTIRIPAQALEEPMWPTQGDLDRYEAHQALTHTASPTLTLMERVLAGLRRL